MNVPPIPPTKPPKPQPTFGILKGYKKTPYGDYMWGVYKKHKIEVYDAKKYDQKLIYVSEEDTWRWVKSKFTYVQDKVKKVVKSQS